MAIQTGIYIHVLRGGKWGNYDIADPEISTGEILVWIRSKEEHTVFLENLILALLHRPMIAKE